MEQQNQPSNDELRQYALDAVENSIAAWREIRRAVGFDGVVFLDEHGRALHRRGYGKVVELLAPDTFERVCLFGASSLRDVVAFDGPQGSVALHPKRLVNFIDETIASAQSSLRFLRHYLENHE
jgi:hypothetical protein